jgi:hypothetical protein
MATLDDALTQASHLYNDYDTPATVWNKEYLRGQVELITYTFWAELCEMLEVAQDEYDPEVMKDDVTHAIFSKVSLRQIRSAR